MLTDLGWDFFLPGKILTTRLRQSIFGLVNIHLYLLAENHTDFCQIKASMSTSNRSSRQDEPSDGDLPISNSCYVLSSLITIIPSLLLLTCLLAGRL